MLKNNLELNNKISLMLQETLIDFFFIDVDNILYFDDTQLLMSKNTKDRLLEEKVISDDYETASNTMVVDNLNDDFIYVGNIYKNLEVDKNGDIYVKYLNGMCLVYVK